MTEIYMCDPVRKVRDLYATSPISEFKTTFDLLQAHAEILLAAQQSDDKTATFQISNWHPVWVSKKADEILAADFTADDARLTLARELGFADVEDAKKRSSDLDQTFEACVDIVLAGDLAGLKSQLTANPSLAKQTSSFGHRATLLNYLGSNGVETWRQVVPMNIVEVARVLLDAGAEVAATMNVYGGQFDTIAMVETSAHPAEAGVVQELLDFLKGLVE